MQPHASAGSRLSILGAATAAALVALACWGVVPAWAHDRLVAVDPTTGSQLESAPDRIELTFSETVQAQYSKVVVTGPDGSDRAVGPVAVHDGVVTQALATGGPAGPYTVAYRVVSADGHPVSGRSAFTVNTSPTAQAPQAQNAPAVVPPGTSLSDPGPTVTGTAPPAAARAVGADPRASGGAPSGRGQQVAATSGGVLALLAAGGWLALRRGSRRRLGVKAGR